MIFSYYWWQVGVNLHTVSVYGLILVFLLLIIQVVVPGSFVKPKYQTRLSIGLVTALFLFVALWIITPAKMPSQDEFKAAQLSTEQLKVKEKEIEDVIHIKVPDKHNLPKPSLPTQALSQDDLNQLQRAEYKASQTGKPQELEITIKPGAKSASIEMFHPDEKTGLEAAKQMDD